MKLFSRKALVAGAAAVALSFAGTSAAVAAEETTAPSEAPAPGEGQAPGEDGQTPGEPGEDGQDNTGNGGSSSNNGDDENKGSSDMEAKDISAWISVFTAVIGALGALFSFASKYLGFKL